MRRSIRSTDERNPPCHAVSARSIEPPKTLKSSMPKGTDRRTEQGHVRRRSAWLRHGDEGRHNIRRRVPADYPPSCNPLPPLQHRRHVCGCHRSWCRCGRRVSSPDCIQTAASAGYEKLAQLPQDISTRLEGLFQARPDPRRLYEVLNAAIDPGNTAPPGRSGLWLVVAGKAWWFVGGCVDPRARIARSRHLERLSDRLKGPVAHPHRARPASSSSPSPSPSSSPSWGLLAGKPGAAEDRLRSHRRATHGATPALTGWLADKIDDIAGVDATKSCLTLGNLWGEEAVGLWKRGSDTDWMKSGPMWRARSPRRIDLEVMTTDLTLRRPFRMPFSTQSFMFSKSEWCRLLPRAGRQPQWPATSSLPSIGTPTPASSSTPSWAGI